MFYPVASSATLAYHPHRYLPIVWKAFWCKGNHWRFFNRRVRKILTQDLLKRKSKISMNFFCTLIITPNSSKSWALWKGWNWHLIIKKPLRIVIDISVWTCGYGLKKCKLTQTWIQSVWPICYSAPFRM